MPSRPDRIRVWRGEIKRTKGGLTKADLMKNKSGKIVSRRRSAAAKGNSNLGNWLRKKGQKFTDKPRKVLTEAEKDEMVKQFIANNKKEALLKKKAAYGSLKEKKKKAAPKKAAPKKKKREVISLLDDDDEVPAKPYKVSVSNIRKDKRKKKEVDYGEFDPSDFDY